MGLFSNPLGHAGYPPNVTGTPETQPSAVRAATLAEAEVGVLDNCYISPLTQQAATSTDFASPPVLGFGSTTARPVHATTLSSTGATSIGTGASSVVGIASGTGSTLGFFGTTAAIKQTQGAITNSVTPGGTTGTIANFTDLTTYATDAPTIQHDIYQLGLGLQGCIAALRTYGLLG